VGRFSEDYPCHAVEDFEYGLRLAATGMRAQLVPGADVRWMADSQPGVPDECWLILRRVFVLGPRNSAARHDPVRSGLRLRMPRGVVGAALVSLGSATRSPATTTQTAHTLLGPARVSTSPRHTWRNAHTSPGATRVSRTPRRSQARGRPVRTQSRCFAPGEEARASWAARGCDQAGRAGTCIVMQCGPPPP
jgi:hypothetical protein